MGERLDRTFFNLQTPMSRRAFLGKSVAAAELGIAGLLVACSQQTTRPLPPTSAPAVTRPGEGVLPTPSPVSKPGGPFIVISSEGPSSYPLSKDSRTDAIFDERIELSRRTAGQHPFLDSIFFSYDPGYVGGSLRMDPVFNNAGEMRITSIEKNPDPGVIYCHPHLIKKGPSLEPFHPVIRFGSLDIHNVYLGFKNPGEDCNNTYNGTIAYQFQRDPSSGLMTGQFMGLATIDPTTLKPRDAEAAQSLYWQLSCLT
jgi:hypothetical protein